MMKNLCRLAFSALLAGTALAPARAQDGWNAYWRPMKATQLPAHIRPDLPASESLIFEAGAQLSTVLADAPRNAAQALQIELPGPAGNMQVFRVWQNEVLSPGLAAKYPELRTLSAVAVGDPMVTARLNLSPRGFRAMVFDRSGTYFIDPYSEQLPGYYQVYRSEHYERPGGRMHCDVSGEAIAEPGAEKNGAQQRVNGATRKQYRLALACTEEYAAAVGGATPTKATVLAAMALSVNRVDGVYERELAVGFQLIPNTDTLIFLPGSNDPYTNNSGGTMLGQNQTEVTNRIGNANYDFGHVFSTGGGGIANLGCICRTGDKAKGVTGSPSPVGDPYDIDYVAHEIGHQFAGNHTFNANTGSCSGNRASTAAYEPGSGVTIMAYAGLCNFNNNVANNSIPVFHARSLEEITNYITTGTGATCALTSVTANVPPALPAFSATYAIPALTPFELTGPAAVDVDHDTLTYSWEQWNRSGAAATYTPAEVNGPIFRSYLPDSSRTRVFPSLPKLLGLVFQNQVGDQLPQSTRRLTFRMTVRDVLNGVGTFNFADDSVVLNVEATGAAFEVTEPIVGTTLSNGTPLPVSWNVAGTTAAPISTANVDIYLSTDGGYTWPYLLAAGTPNDGQHTVSIPAGVTTASNARIKVKGSNNVFFNISGNFNIREGQSVPGVRPLAGLSVFPLPASNELHIGYLSGRSLDVTILNAVGQHVWSGAVQGETTLQVAGWARGVYHLKASDAQSGARIVKSLSLQ